MPSTVTTMETVQENRSAARPHAGTTAAIPADCTAGTLLFTFNTFRSFAIKYIPTLVCTNCDTFRQDVETFKAV